MFPVVRSYPFHEPDSLPRATPAQRCTLVTIAAHDGPNALLRCGFWKKPESKKTKAGVVIRAAGGRLAIAKKQNEEIKEPKKCEPFFFIPPSHLCYKLMLTGENFQERACMCSAKEDHWINSWTFGSSSYKNKFES